MKPTLLYCHVTQGVRSAEFAARFVGTLLANPAGADFDLVVGCNGGPPSTEIGLMFAPFESVAFYPRLNDAGWDLSLYIDASHNICKDAELLLCMGESCYFHRPGWLQRIVEEWQRYGPGMYGLYSSFIQRPHMNTTAFATHPRLLREYPFSVKTHGERYNFEHGHNSFWRYVRNRGMPTRLCTFNGCWEPFLWRYDNDILFKGDQSACLAMCNHTERYANADQATQRAWAAHADTTTENLR